MNNKNSALCLIDQHIILQQVGLMLREEFANRKLTTFIVGSLKYTPEHP